MDWGVFNQETKEVLDSFLLEDVMVEPGKAFGYPAYYINGKMFACIYEDGVSLKAPPDLVAELLQREGGELFEPMPGRKMKEWVVIKHDDPEQYREDGEVFETGKQYVYSLSMQKKKKKT